ncbi:MAG TPA: hypothetical protein VFJ70_21670 [Burkholderiales bacterium]|nr:hypothetical protein [Burkholderiales bacterium]
MRVLLAVAACAAFVSGCESMNQKIDASRQDRCQRADWKEVGLRDGVGGTRLMADRYEYICGDLFNAQAYKEGFQQGLAKKPAAPGM